MLTIAALPFVLLFAPPHAPADPIVLDALELEDPDAEPEASDEEATDPRLAELLAGLSPEAAERFEAMDDADLDAALERYIAGESLPPADLEIAVAIARMTTASIDAELAYQTGEIMLQGGLAALHLGTQFRYLAPADARRVLVDVWDNPPETGDGQLGMIVPADLSPAHPLGWGVVITYIEDGHVEDDDADDIDYDELLEEMQADTRAANPERTRRGFPSMELIGWAATPHYDSETKRLYWAQHLRVDGAEGDTLNYAIRVLGRKGVLELNAIGGMAQFDTISPEMEKVLATVEFQQGNRYADFDPDIDAVAAYGIGGLVAGKLLAKAGIFAVLLKILIAGKKALLLGLLAVGLFVRKLFGGRSASE